MRNEFSSRPGAKVPRVYPRAEVVEGRRAFCRQKFGAEGLNLTPLRKNVTTHQQLH